MNKIKAEPIFLIFVDKDGTLTNTDRIFRQNKNDKSLGDMKVHNKFEGNLLLESALYLSLKVYNNIIPYRENADIVTNSWDNKYETIIATKSPGADFDSNIGKLIRKDLVKTLQKNNIHYDNVMFAGGYKRTVASSFLPSVIIEDNPLTIEKLRNAGFTVIRLKTPYNDYMKRNEQNDEFTYAAENWMHVQELVEKIYEKHKWEKRLLNIKKLQNFKDGLSNEDMTKIYIPTKNQKNSLIL